MKRVTQPNCLYLCLAAIATLCQVAALPAQILDQQLAAEPASQLARAARELGDASRGSILFYQPHMACTKCHLFGQQTGAIGPDLTKLEQEVDDVYLVESVLQPSKVIKKGFESVTVITVDGKSMTGLLVEQGKGKLVLRDASQDFRLVTISDDDIEQRAASNVSIMPAGQANALASRQQFLDLIRYLMEIRDGGLARAKELEPPPSLYAAPPLPDYEQEIDHAGMISSLDQESFRRGEAIYNRLCINCHGTHDRPGSLPTSRRFAADQLKNGHDPFTMYQTLTRGFGMMVPQTWMVPQQKYDVIHYIREAYLKTHNSSQYALIDKAYLDSLPKGTTRGPKPSSIFPWEQMDYGPNLVATYEIGSEGTNFAYKGNAIRLDHGPGGVSQGRFWMVYDYDTLRVAAAWSGKGFIDFNGINFNGRHAIHPRIVGRVHFANPTGPGWANPENGDFQDNRLRGRDDRPYGPLPRHWAHYKGMYYHGNDTIVAYTVGDTQVLEMPGLITAAAAPVFKRTLNIGPRSRDMLLQVAQHASGADLSFATLDDGQVVALGPRQPAAPAAAATSAALQFNGATRVEIARPDDFDLREADYTIYARIKTRKGGTIFCKTSPDPEWVPDGKTFFVRGGQLCFDIGWVGVVRSRRKVNDGRWHDVMMTYEHQTGQVRLYVDGKLDGQGRLKPRQPVNDHVVRIGYTADNFPQPQSFFDGQISEVRFYQRAIDAQEISQSQTSDQHPLGRWILSAVKNTTVPDQTGGKHGGDVVVGAASGSSSAHTVLVAGLAGRPRGAEWLSGEEGDLRLKIPLGTQPLRFTLWLANLDSQAQVEPLVASLVLDDAERDLTPLTKGGPPRWPDVLKTQAVIGQDEGPLAADVLTHPANNPWFCRMRLTGFDFFSDGDRAAVCDWDGNVWLVSGLAQLPKVSPPGRQQQAAAQATDAHQLSWRRIASGLFQPLGLTIVDGRIYVACRDQICILHDLNGDGETDFYENFNNDHQVTDHFHEFAMGLQTDSEGNFYYAKSARHALPALVPHHGTLLRVSKDGARTDILATGFRAANGVCINPDGTFIVTDQEGHWNPKNRINWVTEGGFYGNMFGYHDVSDASDEAMAQPLCWITNAFDRSPAELLWVDSKSWGPLQGALLNFSYGYGKVYVVPHEEVNGQKQGGMCQLPVPQFPTGVMRGRFQPGDGQLYACGMFAWAGNQQQAGGFYRIRYTGQPIHVPVGLQAKRSGMSITFSSELDVESAAPENYAVKVWSLRRTADYGSKHYNERSLNVVGAQLSDDRRTVRLEIPKIQPTWCMEIKYSIKAAGGQTVNGVIHNTVHHLGPDGAED